MQRILIQLGQNIALLLSAALVYGMAVPQLARLDERWRGLLLGAFLGAVAWAGMFLPVNVVDGVQIDGRVVLVSVAAFVGGLPAALVAPVLPILHRVHMGGVGALPGVAALLGGAVVGLILRQLWRTRPRRPLWSYLVLGVLVSVQALLWTFALPRPLALEVLPLFFMPVLVTYTSGTVLLGTLLAHQQERHLALSRLKEEIAHKEETQRSLHMQQERLEAIFEHTVDGLCVARDGRVVLVNAAFLRIIDGAAAPIGQPTLDWLSPDARDTVARLVRDDGSSAAAIVQHASRGRVRSLEVRVARYGADGEYTLLVVRDVTDQVQLEEQLRQAQKMDAIGQLAGGIAHDFNNLLTAMGGHAELMGMLLGPGSPAADSLAEIGKAVERARRLVEQILAFSRKQVSRRQSTPLAPIVDDVLALLRATIPPRVELVKNVDADAWPVMADPSQLHQVLLNLCTNSWHALEDLPGRGRIEICVCNLTPREGADEAPLVRLSVIDNGAGMTPEVARRMFEPFYTTRSQQRGTGLGLAVVHGIVQAHQGTIQVDTRPGQGTAVRVVLPAAIDQPQAGQAVLTSRLLRGAGQRVLHVDDEGPIVSLVSQVLTRLGYMVDGFVDAEQALRAFGSQPDAYALVVSDLNMPTMSGLEFAQRVRRLRRDLPVLITSGFITDDVRARAAALGRCEVIAKPSTVEELSIAVHRLVSDDLGRFAGGRVRPEDDNRRSAGLPSRRS